MSRLLDKYRHQIVAKLKQEFGLKNPMAVPKITKVVINVGTGDITKDETAYKKVIEYMTALSGQKPLVTKAKKSIAEFKIREGSPVGLKVTLRKKRAFDFLDKLFSIVLPRERDFRGVKKSGFDGKGNYTLGLTEQTIFPEVKYDKIDRVRGMEITIVTNSQNSQKAKRLLEELGLPLEKI
jgi:large subunit ribosomal protein L5